MKKAKKLLPNGKVAIVIVSVVLALFMAGCDLAGGGLSARLSPPSWSHGLWEYKAGDTTLSTLTFSSDNVILQYQQSGTGFDFKALGKLQGMNITDSVVSDTVYELTLKGDGTTQIFTFTKKSATTLDMQLNTNGIIQSLDNYIKK